MFCKSLHSLSLFIIIDIFTMASSIFVGFFLFAILFRLSLARTDLSGCVSSTAGASLVWYVPDTGETCEFLDCGGGRAPPKTTVPGCAAYSGTATYSPSYLPGYGPASSFSSASAASTTSDSTDSASSMVVTSMPFSQSATSEALITASSQTFESASLPSGFSNSYYSYYYSSSNPSAASGSVSSTSYYSSSSSHSVPSGSTSAASSTRISSSRSSTATSTASIVNADTNAGALLKISGSSFGIVGLVAAMLG